MGDRLVGGWTNEWLGARMGVNVGGVGFWVHSYSTPSQYFGWMDRWVDR